MVDKKPDGVVFISYRRSDGSEYANEISALLRAAGLRVWRDVSDMPAGNITESIKNAIKNEISDAVLVLTPELAKSDVVRDTEAPMLLDRSNNEPHFTLSVLNTVSDDNGKIDYDAPVRLLGASLGKPLRDFQQYDGRFETGIEDLIRALLRKTMEARKAEITQRGDNAVIIDVQTRVSDTTAEGKKGDLQIRLNPAERGQLNVSSLHDLRRSLPLVVNAVKTVNVEVVRFTGGAHLSVAAALGAAFSREEGHAMEICDLDKHLWRSKKDKEIPDDFLRVNSQLEPSLESAGRCAVFVTLKSDRDLVIFDELVKAERFSEIMTIECSDVGEIDSRMAGALSKKIEEEIRNFASQSGKQREVHFIYHGPMALAMLVLRLMNTYNVVTYERFEGTDGSHGYRPTLRLKVGDGIAEVLDRSDVATDGA